MPKKTNPRKKQSKIKTINTRVPSCLIQVADESVIEVIEKAPKKKLLGRFGRNEFLEHLSSKAPEVVRELIGTTKKRKAKQKQQLEVHVPVQRVGLQMGDE